MDRNEDENICEGAQEWKLDQYIDHLNYSYKLTPVYVFCLISISKISAKISKYQVMINWKSSVAHT